MRWLYAGSTHHWRLGGLVARAGTRRRRLFRVVGQESLRAERGWQEAVAVHDAGEIVSSPAIGADGTIYFGSHDKKFYALAADGQKKWEFATGGPILSSPALNKDQCLYFTSVDGCVYALNLDGSLRWRLRTGSITESSPVIGMDGTIYVGVHQHLWAITPDGQKKWGRVGGQDYPFESPPVVLADGSICCVSRLWDAVLFQSGGSPAVYVLPLWLWLRLPGSRADRRHLRARRWRYCGGRFHCLAGWRGAGPHALAQISRQRQKHRQRPGRGTLAVPKIRVIGLPRSIRQ